MADQVVIKQDHLREGVRFCKDGRDILVVGANGRLLDTLEGTDVAECVEALQRNRTPYYICIEDQMVQVTR